MWLSTLVIYIMHLFRENMLYELIYDCLVLQNKINNVDQLLLCWFVCLDFSLGEMEEYIFEEDGDSKIQKLFSATEDTIVERGNEVIEVVLSSNEPAVRLGINISLIFITDDDGQLTIIMINLHSLFHVEQIFVLVLRRLKYFFLREK